MYQVKLTKEAAKFLKRSDPLLRKRLIKAIDNLQNDPYPNGCKKLISYEQYYRIRVGDYRIVYQLFKNKLIIYIIRIRHRKDVYKEIN